MRTFTYMDHVNGVCSVAEIDTPWIARWSSADAAMGLCEADMIGMLKPAPDAPGLDAEEVMSDDIFNIEMAAYRADPARYRSSNASNLNKLLDVAARRQEKREESPAPELGKLSAADLQRMSLTDLKLLLVRVVMEYVPEDRREEALVAFRQG